MTRRMSVQQCDELQTRMLKHFSLMPPGMNNSVAVCASMVGNKRIPKATRRAMEISDAFIRLEREGNFETYVSIEDTINDVRYGMGISMIAWFLIRIFATAIIKWLWHQYYTVDGGIVVVTTQADPV